MKDCKLDRSFSVPPADIILNLLNDEPQKDIELLDYYDGYIHAAATETVYTTDGNRKGVFINEDLMQEIRVEFLRSLPVLRQKLISSLLQNKAVVIVLPKNESHE